MDAMTADAGKTLTPLTRKQRAFVEYYLACWNATEAARRAGYSHPNKQGPRLLVNVGIAAEIERRLAEMAMSANEVLFRLTEQARFDMGDILTIPGQWPYIDIQKAKRLRKTRVLKKIKVRDDGGLEVEAYDAQAALVQLGKYHGLFVDRSDVTSNGQAIGVVIQKVAPRPDDSDA